MQGMHELVFGGNVVNGIGKHKELVIPGRSRLDNAPPDWPEKFFPGSVNLRVTEYPAEFATRGITPTTKSLDSAGFDPALTIAQGLLGNNRLVPISSMPLRGTAQAWRASLTANGQAVLCWALRRLGSGLADQIELVSQEGLRVKLGLTVNRDWPARVVIQGTWRS